jgi:hypothetical protein
MSIARSFGGLYLVKADEQSGKRTRLSGSCIDPSSSYSPSELTPMTTPQPCLQSVDSLLEGSSSLVLAEAIEQKISHMSHDQATIEQVPG